MDAGAVVALVRVLDDQLPVGRDVVDHAMRSAEVLEGVVRAAVDETPERLLERLGSRGEVDEHEAAPRRERDREKAELGTVERLRTLHVRCAEEPAVEVVRPGVVRAEEFLEAVSLGVFHETRASVTADIVERPQFPPAVAEDEHTRARDLDRTERTRGRELVLSADALPRGAEEATHLFLKDGRVGEERARQGRGAVERSVDAAEGTRECLGPLPSGRNCAGQRPPPVAVT